MMHEKIERTAALPTSLEMDEVGASLTHVITLANALHTIIEDAQRELKSPAAAMTGYVHQQLNLGLDMLVIIRDSAERGVQRCGAIDLHRLKRA